MRSRRSGLRRSRERWAERPQTQPNPGFSWARGRSGRGRYRTRGSRNRTRIASKKLFWGADDLLQCPTAAGLQVKVSRGPRPDPPPPLHSQLGQHLRGPPARYRHQQPPHSSWSCSGAIRPRINEHSDLGGTTPEPRPGLPPGPPATGVAIAVTTDEATDEAGAAAGSPIPARLGARADQVEESRRRRRSTAPAEG